MKLSASKLKTYDLCPLQYHYIYNLKLIQKKSPAMILGSQYHEAVREYTLNQFNEDAYSKEVIRLLENYKRNPVKGTIVSTEERFSFDLDDFEITGFIDRMDADKIVEYKTSSFNYKDEHVDNFQTDVYILEKFLETGQVYPMIYHVNNKKRKRKTYKPQIINVEKKKSDMEPIKEKIIEAADKIKNEEFDCKQ
jgi:RecB family exonuclease